jgi:hypothetical protein
MIKKISPVNHWWEEEWKSRLIFWNSPEGYELSLDLLEQGYETILWEELMRVYACGFTVINIIKKIKELKRN